MIERRISIELHPSLCRTCRHFGSERCISCIQIDGHDTRTNYEPTTFSESISEAKKEMVNHPDHYQSENGLEVIDVIKAFTKDLNGIEAFDTGNIIKYACRWPRKNGIEDLKKVVWYAQDLIKYLEEKEEK